MKKTKVFFIISVFTILAAFSGCSSESSDSSTAKLSLTSETSRQQTTQLHSDIDYNLDKEYKIGDLRFNASSTWKCVSESDEMIYFKINDIGLFVNCSDYMSSIMTDEEVFEAHMGSNYSDVEYVKVADNNAVIFSKPDDYSRNVVTVHNNKSYWLEAKGLTDEKNDCNKIISEVFNTITLPNMNSIESTAPTTIKPTEKNTEKVTEAPKIINNTSANGFRAEGSGDYVAEGLKVTEYAVLHIEYNGLGNFSVISYEGDDYDELLVNRIGNYSGDVLITHSGNFNLEINAKGNWSITSSGLAIDDVTSFSGTGDAVTGITTHSGGNWKITHNGGGNFSVVEYGMAKGYMDLLVNEIGDYSGTVKAESGDNVFFQINAEGAWTMERQ